MKKWTSFGTVSLVITLGLWALSIGSSCARYNPSELHAICLRHVDEQGFLRGRDAQFNTAGYGRILREERYRFSHDGRCVPSAQGPSKRIVVCLVKSSRCFHDRTSNVWEDQWPYYKERYPGSHKGKCKTEKPDTCMQELSDMRGPDDWIGWMQHMQDVKRQRMRQ